MSQFKCAAPGCRISDRRYEKRLKRPSGCPTTDYCDIVPCENGDPIPEPAASEAEIPAVLRYVREKATPDTSPLATETLALFLVDRDISIPIPSILGRSGFDGERMFGKDLTVSRKHADVTAALDGVRISNIATSGNLLYVDGTQLVFGASQVMEIGIHEVRFGAERMLTLEVRRCS